MVALGNGAGRGTIIKRRPLMIASDCGNPPLMSSMRGVGAGGVVTGAVGRGAQAGRGCATAQTRSPSAPPPDTWNIRLEVHTLAWISSTHVASRDMTIFVRLS